MTSPGRRSRLLIHIPIVHSQADMGSSSEQVRKIYVEKKGLDAWQESRREIDRFWKDLEDRIAALDLDFHRVRLYQDALPVCGHEAEIVRDLDKAGGPNYRILTGLMTRGATLEGTESPDLLLKEYQLLKARDSVLSQTGGAKPFERTSASALETLLEQRDRYIAARIGATLRPGEVGMLFLGALHRATRMLPSTIRVVGLEECVSCNGGR